MDIVNKTDFRNLPDQCSVAIIGAGPAGLAAAAELSSMGVNNVWVLERSDETGGIPRYCGHSPFGMREFKRIYGGRLYAKTLTQKALDQGAKIAVNTTVITIQPGGELLLSTPDGSRKLKADAVLLAMGARETPRSARLVSGGRPTGITTTGALQSTAYGQSASGLPFTRPIVVGTELIAFSALLSCRQMGIKPVAMIEPGYRTTAFRPSAWLPRLLGTDIHYRSRINKIIGEKTVTGVEIVDQNKVPSQINCDGVIFTGQFVPESSLVRNSHLALDPATGGPVIDQFGRCSDPAYFAAGNVLRGIETAGWCWQEGVTAAQHIFSQLNGQLISNEIFLDIRTTDQQIKYLLPQRYIESNNVAYIQSLQLQARCNTLLRGQFAYKIGEQDFQSTTLNKRPEQRILIRT